MIYGLILAGGLSRRMGGEPKAFMDLAGKPLISHAIERLAPQVDGLAINANQFHDRLSAYGYAIIADNIDGFAGPLAGIEAGLSQVPTEASWLVCAACDAPFFPNDLVQRITSVEAPSGVVFASSNGRSHPVFSAWRPSLLPALRAALEGGLRKVDAFEPAAKATLVEWDQYPDPFFNINRPDDLEKAQALA